MEFIATTISEHIFHEGLLQGKAEGEVSGQIKMLEMFYQLGILQEEQFQLMIHPLRKKLEELSDSG